MKKITLLASMFAFSSVFAQNDIDLPNGDFEDAVISTHFSGVNGTLSIGSETRPGTTGSQSAKLVIGSGGGNSQIQGLGASAVAVNRTETLILSGWVKAPTSAVLKLVAVLDEDGAGGTPIYVGNNVTMPDNGWHLMEFEVPVESTGVGVYDTVITRLVISGGVTSGDVVYLDDVNLSANTHIAGSFENTFTSYNQKTFTQLWNSNANLTATENSDAAYVHSGLKSAKAVTTAGASGSFFIKGEFSRKDLVLAGSSNGIGADQPLGLDYYYGTCWVKVEAGEPDVTLRAYITPKINGGSIDFNFQNSDNITVSASDGWVQLNTGVVDFTGETSLEQVEMRVQTASNPDALTFYIDDMDLRWNDTGESLSVNTLKGEVSFSVYPNPAKDVFNVVAAEAIDTVELFNIMGQMVSSTAIEATAGKVDVSNLASGVYTLKISMNGAFALQRVVVE